MGSYFELLHGQKSDQSTPKLESNDMIHKNLYSHKNKKPQFNLNS